MATAKLPIFMRIGLGEEFAVGTVELEVAEAMDVVISTADLLTEAADGLRRLADEKREQG